MLLLPVLAVMLWFLVYCVRLPDAQLRVEDAAHQAARAASTTRTTAAAEAARATVARALRDSGVTCRTHTTHLTGNPQPGATATATVRCAVDLRDLAAPLRLPGTRSLAARSSAPVDVYCGGAARASSSPERLP